MRVRSEARRTRKGGAAADPHGVLPRPARAIRFVAGSSNREAPSPPLKSGCPGPGPGPGPGTAAALSSESSPSSIGIEYPGAGRPMQASRSRHEADCGGGTEIGGAESAVGGGGGGAAAMASRWALSKARKRWHGAGGDGSGGGSCRPHAGVSARGPPRPSGGPVPCPAVVRGREWTAGFFGAAAACAKLWAAAVCGKSAAGLHAKVSVHRRRLHLR